jgi:hypothetical protein
MITPVKRLKEVSHQLLERRPLGDEQARWLGAALDRFLNRQSATLEEAFELRFPRGGVPWWLEDAMRHRDEALRRMSDEFFGEDGITARAARIHRLATRYAASAWRRDQELPEPPKSYLGTPRHYLWAAFKSGAPMPLGERQLRNILRS